MRKLNILKTILDFALYFSILGGIGITIFLSLYLFDSEMDIPFKIKGQEILPNSKYAKPIICVNAASGLLFLYSIYLLRKVVIHFKKLEIFKNDVIKLLNLIGKLILVSTILSSSSIFIYKMANRIHSGFSIDFGDDYSFLISVSLGLLFMVISEIFKIAKNMKEENELTI